MIDPELAAAAVAAAASVKTANEVAKLPGVSAVVGVVNDRMKAYAEAKLLPALRRILPLPEAAQLAVDEAVSHLGNVAPEALVEPDPTVTAGVFEAMQTRADIPELRTMFGQLLASAMRRDRAGEAHTAFVEVLRQLAPADAILFTHVRGRVRQRGVDAELHPTAPHWRERPRLIVRDATELARDARLPDAGRGPLVLDNLKRLGLLADLMTDATGSRIETGRTLGVVLTPFGEAFARACLPNTAE